MRKCVCACVCMFVFVCVFVCGYGCGCVCVCVRVRVSVCARVARVRKTHTRSLFGAAACARLGVHARMWAVGAHKT